MRAAQESSTGDRRHPFVSAIASGMRRFFNKFLDLPAVFWVLACFFVVFFAYFIVPTYLNAYHEMRLFSDFPSISPLGYDLNDRLTFSRLLVDTGSPYNLRNFYPPLQSLFTMRFMYSGPDTSYIFMTAITYLCFIATAFLFPLLQSKKFKLNSLAVFGIITGLYSFGLWFEIERGQFNVFAMLICFAAIFLYHRFPRLRLVAYLLFIVAVNLKVYPGIFVFCFATDLHDWQNNLKRWGLLLLGCFACLFVLGWQVFNDFIKFFVSELGHPSNIWVGNHSIGSFVSMVVDLYKSNQPLYESLRAAIFWLKLPFFLIFGVCLLGVFLIAYRKNIKLTNPYIILIFTLGTMLIPATSHDFKLSILVIPMVLWFNSFKMVRSGSSLLDLTSIVLVCLLSISYSATLFLHAVELPLLLGSNFPALVVMLVSSVLLLLVRSAQSRRIADQSAFQDLV